MDITTTARDHGIYVIRTVGKMTWAEGGGRWQGNGVRLVLMDGRKQLASCKLEVPPSEAEERGAAEAARIEPWVRTLRYLAVVQDLQSTLLGVSSLAMRLEEEKDWAFKPSLELTDELFSYATREEIDAAQASEDPYSLATKLVRRVAERYRQQIEQGMRAALAYAPHPVTNPIHPAWEQPTSGELEGESTAQMTARNLLAAWANARDLRDPLITWAVQNAGLTRTMVQQVTSVSRATINRLLPSAD